ncbi:SDR family NAD(P)-dependent oxidoreductase [Nocardia cerradoensis]|uniref:Rhamnolipids biosynthesis 3-oxoacyl-[acyl-carrier-protein] reductase n=1 Tax=Nocardia cerradoensis TaxID=85688 RepID=A0A231H986_9NOCA|nr:SDR family NAD(P)-dependent oxidoreductase [Nocardia cerradoensis]NKY42564.1 SDR family NAD(P)-dependent oxidoreductase [Nocardia cerradoensis]OXR45583.1 Rhamnolipids biosynthesis 3-oxoacyl-[acyl-carrier-protein] reductase [Nocardia cerradoensis]
MNLNGLFEVRGKTALVTGASGGIGLTIATGLAEAGCRVLICSRKIDEITAVAEKLSVHGTVIPFAADLSTPEGIATAGDIVGSDQPLHVLVNNAGATFAAPIDEFPRSAFEDILNLNLIAPFELIKTLLPSLRLAATREDPGRIINISSAGALLVPDWDGFSYTASKAGLIHLSRHLGKALAKDQITVNTIAPGHFPSKMTSSLINDDGSPKGDDYTFFGGRVGTPEDMVGAIVYLSSRAGAWLTGLTIPIAGGLSTIS